MRIFIAQDMDGDIVISDSKILEREESVRSYEIVFPDNGQKREINLCFKNDTKAWKFEEKNEKVQCGFYCLSNSYSCF